MLIQLEQTSFGYDGRAVVRVDALALRAGRSLGIFGPNGSGKTTLVRGITGLLSPIEGRVVRHGEIRVAYLPQHAAMESHWPMNGFDAAAMVVSAHRPLGWIGPARSGVMEMMTRLAVHDLAERPFFKLSGGQQQRVLLAGALVVRPQLLVLDEPTSGLDVRSRRMLLDVLIECARDGLASVMISHEIEDLTEICDEVAWLHPAEESESASRVEIVVPAELTRRLISHAGEPGETNEPV